MSAATVPAASRPTAEGAPLELYRDDGPLAAALGHVAGHRLPLSQLALLLIAAAPGAVAIATAGGGAPRGLVAGAVAWAVLAGGVSSGRPLSGPLAWATPPTLRAIEYAGLLWIAAVAGASSLPAAFALLCALAYHHYDTVYGLRHRGSAPPRWLQALAGGWDGRLLAAVLALLAGALPAAYYVAAAVLGAVFLGETVAEWRRVGPRRRAPGPADELDEEEQDEEAAG